MLAKRRNVMGERVTGCKLTEQDIRKIRERLLTGCTQKEIAHDYGLWPSTISDISQGVTWKHVL
jgi:IS30 family transposase